MVDAVFSLSQIGWVQQLARKYLVRPEFIDLVGADDIKIPSTIKHWTYVTARDSKEEILGLIVAAHGFDKRSIIFTQVIFFALESGGSFAAKSCCSTGGRALLCLEESLSVVFSVSLQQQRQSEASRDEKTCSKVITSFYYH